MDATNQNQYQNQYQNELTHLNNEKKEEKRKEPITFDTFRNKDFLSNKDTRTTNYRNDNVTFAVQKEQDDTCVLSFGHENMDGNDTYPNLAKEGLANENYHENKFTLHDETNPPSSHNPTSFLSQNQNQNQSNKNNQSNTNSNDYYKSIPDYKKVLQIESTKIM